MSTSSSALTRYHRTARALGAKSALPLAAGAAALLTPSAHAVAVAYVPTSQNVAVSSGSGPFGIGIYLIGPHAGEVSNDVSAEVNIGILNFPESAGASYDAYGSVVIFNSMDSEVQGVFKLDPVNLLSDGSSYLQKFAGGVDVKTIFSADSSYAYGGLFNSATSYAAPAWVNTTGYAAMRFTRDSNTYYGWLKVQLNDSTSEITLLAFGYNTTPGASLLTGEGVIQAVPEPATSAALLALGAVGLVAYRRRKNLQRAVA